MAELLGIPFSPWSEKARWALDARRVRYEDRVYAPLLGEPALRWKLGKWSGRVTVPVLTDDDGAVYSDSADIARWADGRGQGPLLFPPELDAEVRRFVALSEEGLSAGRAMSLPRLLGDPAALREMVPRPLRTLPLSARIGGFGIWRTLRKYGASQSDAEKHAATFTRVLEALRDALSKQTGSPATVLGRFTFADIAMAQVLAFVEPPAFGLRIGRASRAAFGDPALRERYADLVAWRDALYEAHRPKV